MIRSALIGYGYWGKNLYRNILLSEDFELRAVVDIRAKNLSFPLHNHEVLESIDELDLDSIDAVFLATPAITHYDLVKYFLLAGKHVWVEKPFTADPSNELELYQLAERRNLSVLVDHTFVYSPAIRALKVNLQSDKENGKSAAYYHSTRINFAAIQPDVSVLYDLAIHDLAIMDFLFDGLEIDDTGLGILDKSQKNYFASFVGESTNGMQFSIFVNWLSPSKVRQILVGGDGLTYVYDDMLREDKLKKFSLQEIDSLSKEQVFEALRKDSIGSIQTIELSLQEPLSAAIVEFSDSIRQGKEAPTGLSHIRRVSSALRKIGALYEG
jgi:predicted dehydrogenase